MKKTTDTTKAADCLKIALMRENKAWEKYKKKISETAAAHKEFMAAQMKTNQASSCFYKIKS